MISLKTRMNAVGVTRVMVTADLIVCEAVLSRGAAVDISHVSAVHVLTTCCSKFHAELFEQNVKGPARPPGRFVASTAPGFPVLPSAYARVPLSIILRWLRAESKATERLDPAAAACRSVEHELAL